MLAREIAGLAGLGVRVVASVQLTAVRGVYRSQISFTMTC